MDRDTVRVLEQVDGTRTVADLVSGRQPLAVVRALANLAQQGAVTFGAAQICRRSRQRRSRLCHLQYHLRLVEDVDANVVDTTAPASRRFP